MTLAILSALHDELSAMLPLLTQRRSETVGAREFHRGQIAGHDVVLVLSGIGKVAAAATAAVLCERFAARQLLFTGVAGGLGPGVAVGDVVLARQLLQHDMDASPIFPRWEIPLRGVSRLAADAAMTDHLSHAARQALATPAPALREFGLQTPKLHQGLIVSGDRFVSSERESTQLRRDLPEALAVDMESAALAQVAHDFGRPVAVLRTVSDRADDSAHVDFPRFLAQVAAPYAREIMLNYLRGEPRG